MRGGTPKNMVWGHYIVGKGSYNIGFDFPKHSEWNFKSKTKISNFYHFVCENCVKMAIFYTQNSKKSKFWSQT